MQQEMSNKTCPLCKRLAATNGHAVSTQLCEECRSLIHTIMPGAGSKYFAAAEQAQASGQPQFATAGRLGAPILFDEDLSGARINSQDHQFESASFDPVADYDEIQADNIAAIETEYFDDFETDDNEAHPYAGAMADPIDEAIDPPTETEAAAPQLTMIDEPPESFEDKTPAIEVYRAEEPASSYMAIAEEPAHLISSPREIETGTEAKLEAEAIENTRADKDTETISRMETTSEQETTDPWDDPLPVWEYSRNEYPLYVGLPERQRQSRWKSLIVAVVLLLSVVAAYFIFQSSGGAPQDQNAAVNPEQSKAEPAAAVAPAQATDEAKPASGDVEKTVDTSTGVPANASAGTQWRHALQALASSSQDEANSFAEKMVGAGIPAYVVSADIAGRGKWFRVRVGGFNTAQDAQRFIAEARARAKAAGIKLKDLYVVDYERP